MTTSHAVTATSTAVSGTSSAASATGGAVSSTTPRFVDPAVLKPEQLRADIVRARTELAATLDAIEYKVNVPRKVRTVQRTLTRKIRVVRRQNPSALIAGAVGAAAAVGLAAWGVARPLIENRGARSER